MKKTNFKKALSLILCFVLIAVIALMATGCNNEDKHGEDVTTIEPYIGSSEKLNVVGEGEKEFKFIATDLEGKKYEFEIHTDKKTVGGALSSLGIIFGTLGDYGLYVETVNGITVKYETDGKYWAFYENGKYATNSVDTTQIEEGAIYEFRAE